MKMEFPKYIFDLHYISVIGIVLVFLGTILLHRGNSLKNKEGNEGLQTKIDNQKTLIDSLKSKNEIQISQNSELKDLNNKQIDDLKNQSNLITNLQKENTGLVSIVERLRYPIPDKFFVDLTIDFELSDNDFLSERAKVIERAIIQNRKKYNLPEEKIQNIHFLKESFGLENTDLSEIQNYFKKAFDRIKLDIRINNEKTFISLRNDISVDYFDPPKNQEVDFPVKKSVATLVYLFKEKLFSMQLKNLPVYVQNKHPQMRSYYDFENTNIYIDMYGLENETFKINGKIINQDKYIHEPKFKINRFVLNDNNLLVFVVNQFKKESSHVQKIEKLTEWK